MTQSTILQQFDDAKLEEFEAVAVEAASKAGAYVLGRISSPMEIESKTGRPGRDLVTDVDKNSQVIISDIITERFPEHQFLGEEDQKEEVDPAAELVWAVDPIDGTANYVNGSMTHAVSVALMHRGSPIVGAVWSPWPTSDDGGIVVHARLGGGTKQGGETMSVLHPTDELGRPVSGRLSVLPGNARSAFKFDNGFVATRAMSELPEALPTRWRASGPVCINTRSAVPPRYGISPPLWSSCGKPVAR